jgi:hypothetical protein
LLLYERNHFTELIRLARLLKQDPDHEPILFFSCLLVLSEHIARTCLDEEILCLEQDGRPIEH